MDPDDLVIRPARPDEAETLTHMVFRARAYCDYPGDLMEQWLESGEIDVTQEEIEEDLTYVIEDEEELEVLGFYSLHLIGGGLCELVRLYVMPEHIGSDIRSMLFFHACELAETSGAESIIMEGDIHVSGFYSEMGAEEIAGESVPHPFRERQVPLMRLNL